MTKNDSSHEGNGTSVEYAGFWVRAGAVTIDTVLLTMILSPFVGATYGDEYFSERPSLEFFDLPGPPDFFSTIVLPAAIIILFWIYKQATPGKMLVKAKVVDAQTGGQPTTGQYIGRYFAYYVSAILLGLGFIWVAFDPRKQGWHDKLAGTVVVRHRKQRSVSFGERN
ncbi:MAG: RDD family protein [Nitrospira sp.]|nr:RDD family protein [Nitrospira sp.]